MIARSWRSVWEVVVPFFKYPQDIRRAIYTTNATAYGACSGCHFGSAPPNTAQGVAAPGHPNAANNYGYIKTAMQAGGLMFGVFGAQTLPSDAQLFQLAMYIGQYKAPVFTVAFRSSCSRARGLSGARSSTVDGSSP